MISLLSALIFLLHVTDIASDQDYSFQLSGVTKGQKNALCDTTDPLEKNTYLSCANQKVTLDCGHKGTDYKIFICWADMWRFRNSICNEDGVNYSLNCSTPGLQPLLEQKCFNHRFCEVQWTDVPEGNCQENHKPYVQIMYRCINITEFGGVESFLSVAANAIDLEPRVGAQKSTGSHVLAADWLINAFLLSSLVLLYKEH